MKKTLLAISLTSSLFLYSSEQDTIKYLSKKNIAFALPLQNGESCNAALLAFKARLFQLNQAKEYMNRDAQKFLNYELGRLEEMIRKNPCTLPDGRNLTAAIASLRKKT